MDASCWTRGAGNRSLWQTNRCCCTRMQENPEFYNSDFCILPNILFNKNYIFKKTTWECLLEAFLNNCEIISSNRNNPGTIKAQTAINWKMQEHQHRCPQSEGADQERSLCSKLTSSSLNEIYSLAHGQAKSFMVFKRDKDWAVCNMFAVCLSPLCFLSLFTAPLAN